MRKTEYNITIKITSINEMVNRFFFVLLLLTWREGHSGGEWNIVKGVQWLCVMKIVTHNNSNATLYNIVIQKVLYNIVIGTITMSHNNRNCYHVP